MERRVSQAEDKSKDEKEKASKERKEIGEQSKSFKTEIKNLTERLHKYVFMNMWFY